MPDDQTSKELGPRAQPESLATIAEAFHPLVEMWNEGTTQRVKLQLEAGERSEIREANERRAARWDFRVFGGASLSVVLFLIVYLYLNNRAADAGELLKLVIALVGGGSVGYGIGYVRGKENASNRSDVSRVP